MLKEEYFTGQANLAFNSIIKKGNNLIKMKTRNKRKIDDFYEVWTKTFINLIRRIVGTKCNDGKMLVEKSKDIPY